jgi:hypothetical protein
MTNPYYTVNAVCKCIGVRYTLRHDVDEDDWVESPSNESTFKSREEAEFFAIEETPSFSVQVKMEIQEHFPE